MKTIKAFVILFCMGMAFTACNNPEESYETDTERQEDMRDVENDNTSTDEADDKGTGVDIGVSVDEEGNVDGEAEGNVEIGEDDNR